MNNFYKPTHIRIYVNKKEVYWIEATWSGSKSSPARSLDITLPNLDIYNNAFAAGDTVEMTDLSGKKLFTGKIFTRSKNNIASEISIECYDLLVYLMKSEDSFNFKSGSVGSMINQIAKKSGIPFGDIADSGTSIKPAEPFIGETYYDIILELYKLVAAKTNKKYFPFFENGKVHIRHKGLHDKKFVLSEYKEGMSAVSHQILEIEYSESIEDLVNKVVIVNDEGGKVSEILGQSQSKYGTIQKVYRKSDDESKSDWTKEAKALLQPLHQEAELQALGNVNCISGKGIVIQDTKTGMKGVFYIDDDSHTFSDNMHTMSLSLSFKNLMDGDD